MRTGIAVLLAIVVSAALAEPLRIVQDGGRNRTWRLERDAVYVGDRRIALPGWLHADEGYVCRPDLAIDGQGAAVVSTNVAPILWRVDPVNSRVSQHELVLDADTDKEVGFTGLAYAADQGVFFAISAAHGTLWRIDPLLRRAQHIGLSAPLWKACGLAVERSKVRRTVVLCVRGLAEPRRLHLAPDQRSAYVRNEPCLEQAADADIALTK